MQNFLLQRTASVAQSSCRFISVSTALFKNHYDSLEIPTNATQVEIKSAYYKLSKLYHPDKNKGSEVAAEKFREVNAAYEVLGNFKLRKLYDKGILHTAGAQYADEMSHEVVVEDDPQTKFYKQREKRSEAPTESGATPIYDFDEWSKQQYSASLKRKQDTKFQREVRMAKETDAKNSLKLDRIIYLCMAITFFVVYKSLGFGKESNQNSPSNKPKT